jgi:hypothetical protein
MMHPHQQAMFGAPVPMSALTPTMQAPGPSVHGPNPPMMTPAYHQPAMLPSAAMLTNHSSDFMTKYVPKAKYDASHQYATNVRNKVLT